MLSLLLGPEDFNQGLRSLDGALTKPTEVAEVALQERPMPALAGLASWAEKLLAIEDESAAKKLQS